MAAVREQYVIVQKTYRHAGVRKYFLAGDQGVAGQVIIGNFKDALKFESVADAKTHLTGLGISMTVASPWAIVNAKDVQE